MDVTPKGQLRILGVDRKSVLFDQFVDTQEFFTFSKFRKNSLRQVILYPGYLISSPIQKER